MCGNLPRELPACRVWAQEREEQDGSVIEAAA